MKWIKASDRLPDKPNLVHINFSTDETVFKLTGYFENGDWHRSNGSKISFHPNLKWLDESDSDIVAVEQLAEYYSKQKYGDYLTSSLEGRIKISVSKSSFKDGYEASPKSSNDAVNKKMKEAIETLLTGIEYFASEHSANYVITTPDILMLKDAVSSIRQSSYSQRTVDDIIHCTCIVDGNHDKDCIVCHPSVPAANIHPEDFCQQCNGRNTLWYADNELFNKVNGSPNGIICPSCFGSKAKEMGVSIIFKAVKYPEPNAADQIQELYHRMEDCPLKTHLSNWFGIESFIEGNKPSVDYDRVVIIITDYLTSRKESLAKYKPKEYMIGFQECCRLIGELLARFIK